MSSILGRVMKYFESNNGILYCGNVLEEIKNINDNFVDCVVTSPPYWGLRDYNINDQFGLEATPEEYVKNMVNVFKEVKRVIKKDGICWLVIGDTYKSKGSKNKYFEQHPDPKYPEGRKTEFHKPHYNPHKIIKSKELCGIPWRVAFALQEDGWYIRQDIIWHKPNAMPEPVRSRCTKSHEYVFLLTKSQKYYFNNKNILEEYTKPMNRWGGVTLKASNKSDWDENTKQHTYRNRNMRPYVNGKNRRSVWSINTKSYKGAHFATFPEKLVELCIKVTKENSIIFDPFMGSGTVALVAEKLNRKWIGVDLNKEYCELIIKRIQNEAYKS
jgi:DNA modification methylase